MDESDNDLAVFLSYIIGAIQTLFPEACPTTHSLLTAPQTPPLDYLTTTLINEIADLPEMFLLVLDDYHLIDQGDVHQLVYALMQQHHPRPMHLVTATRQDLPFSVARLRATQKITEFQVDDLCFMPEEIQCYLKLRLGADVSPLWTKER